ncbi:MAG TPA: aldo/keto reductase [Casimicrobiaceae bacterium]|jgi:diketogulonate reductase-like aldo/keto reductase
MAGIDRAIELRSGEHMPVLGLGTWRMGERRDRRQQEIGAVSLGIDLGIKLVDTAEMYGEGEAEKIVGEAIAGRREQVFVVSKVYPHNASKRGVIAACKRSLQRLRTDRLDLYLLHWRGDIPLAETVAGFRALQAEGAIRAWGVSNFDRGDIEELLALPGGDGCAANQVLYNLNERGVEWDLLPLCRRHRIAMMAYSPLDQGRLLRQRALRAIATTLGATPAQVALAWLLQQRDIVVIPKATDATHVHDNVSSANLKLDPSSRAVLDREFPPPRKPTSLRML